jgi:hypothetical protein
MLVQPFLDSANGVKDAATLLYVRRPASFGTQPNKCAIATPQNSGSFFGGEIDIDIHNQHSMLRGALAAI